MQEKKLRDALKELVESLDNWNRKRMAGGVRAKEAVCLGSALEEAKDALASTTEETEMEKLVVWLKGQIKRIPGNTPIDHHLINAFDIVLKHITTQFGEEEGDD